MVRLFAGIILFLGLDLSGGGSILYGQSPPLPDKIKVAILSRMVEYTTLPAPPAIAVTYSRSAHREQQSLALELHQAGFKVDVFEQQEIPDSLHAPIIYLLSPLSLRRAQQFARCNRLVITDDEALLRYGCASFALVLYQSKPQILANKAHITANLVQIQDAFYRLVKMLN